MANRKILINLHSTKNEAPATSGMNLGEIAISHPSDISATTIWTRNNDVMVPFASCAMTQIMIDAAIGAAEKVVAVEKGSGEEHLNIVTGGTNSAKTVTITTEDVMSEEEFNAYSAATKVRIDTNASAITDMVGIVSALTDVVLTGISGDSIIVAEILNPSTGANYVALTHRTGAEVNGFNKLTTDAYGHVTASTAVATEDIRALGFKTSAETGEDLEALSASVISLSAETIAEFSSAFTAIENLSAGTIQLSADTKNAIAQLSAGTIQLSADTKAAIDALSAGTLHDIEVLSGAVKANETNIATVSGDVIELSAATVAIETGLDNLSAVWCFIEQYSSCSI